MSARVLTLPEGAVAGLAQELGVVSQHSDMPPVDVLWVDPEVVRTEGG